MAKAQITIILIIVMILLLIFGIMSYLQSSTTEKMGQKTIQEQRTVLSSAQPLQEYLSQCLGIWALRGLELLGQQGGVIFKSQEGLTDDTSSTNVFKANNEGQTYLRYGAEEGKVVYGMKRLTDKENLAQLNPFVAFQPPEYPYLDFPYRGTLKDDQGIFSVNNLQLLNATPPANSLRENLQRFATAKTISCADFAPFELQQWEMNASPEKAFTEMILTENNIRFFINYPITMTNTKTNAQINIDNVTVEYPFKLLPFFNFINNVADQESTNISFSPRRVQQGNYNVIVKENIFERDDVLVFTDMSSLILDKPYQFYVPRQNRPPALWKIPASQVSAIKICAACFEDNPQTKGSTVSIMNMPHEEDGSINRATLQFDNSKCNTALGIPAMTEINLTAQDPDEDAVTFTVSGAGNIATPTELPITSARWTTLPSRTAGERIHTLRIWADDGTPTQGTNAWQEYQDINVSVVMNSCS